MTSKHLIILVSSLFAISLLIWIVLRLVTPATNKTPKQIDISQANGALTIETPEESISVAHPFEVKLMVDTDNKPVNAVGLIAHFDTNRLQILSMDTTESFCQFYPENRYDNQSGEIKISCGLPNPGFTGQSILAKIVFEPQSVGTAQIRVDPNSQILLNDGKATNILTQRTVKDLNILGKL